jgi:hypothetical protein
MGFTLRAKQILGAAVVAAGVALALLVSRRLDFGEITYMLQVSGVVQTLWRLGVFALVGSFAVYMICSGLRMVNPTLIRTFRFGWGKIIFGVLILYMQLGIDNHFVLNGQTDIHRPSTLSEAVSVLVFDLIGVYLIFRGIRQGFTRPQPQPDILPSQSPE